MQKQWIDVLGPAIIATAGDRLRRLVVDLPPTMILPQVAEVFPPQFDGMAERWFETCEDAEAALERVAGDAALLQLADPGYLATIRPDEIKFSRPGEMLSYVTGEECVLIDRG